MTDFDVPAGWPDYLPGPKRDIFALGVIALNYGHLENFFRSLFAAVTGISEYQVATIFERLSNPARLDILTELMVKNELPDPLKERVRHFVSGYRICAANRHELMHSHSLGGYIDKKTDNEGVVLSRFTRSGNRMESRPTFEELKGVADNIEEYVLFATIVWSDINAFHRLQREGDEARFWRFPLSDKPPLPSPLNWNVQGIDPR